MANLLVDLAYLPIALLYLPILLYQMILLKKNRRGWRERFGAVPIRPNRGPCVWIHGVSLGEINATRSLVAEIARRRPDCEVVISSSTDTGYASARRQYPGHSVFRYPLDFSPIVRRALNRIRPDVLVLMELELWPNILRIAEQRGIEVGIANGRITEGKSMRRFSLPIIRGIARTMVRRLAWIAAQDEAYAERFRRLGAEAHRVVAAGSLKYDTAVVADAIPGDADLASAMGLRGDVPLFVAGSTGPGEESLLLDAYERLLASTPNLQFAIIPRKPERFDEVGGLIESRGYECGRRSDLPDGKTPASSADRPTIFLGDTMGELRKFYSLASVVFVGRSLVPMGGSDMMEVAALSKAPIYGPYVENFADIDRQLVEVDAANKVSDVDALVEAIQECLNDPDTMKLRGARARDVIVRNRGATGRIADLVCASLDHVRARHSHPDHAR